MPSEWNMFVKKVYEEGHAANPSFKFGDALKEASDRKARGEMGTGNVVASGVAHKKTVRKSKRRVNSKRRSISKKRMSSKRRVASESSSASVSLAGGKRRRHKKH